MAKLDEQRSASRRKAEELLTRKKQQEAERLSNRERDSRAMDEKTAKLRALRLAKEASDRSVVKAPTLVSRRKVAAETA
jgi:hypothetical protein